ncbi:MAG TPA: histidine--tRNA ligase [Bacilli bacterium]|nr:histidine--tRNA ligase [Bacilli bacterium]
MKKIKLQNVKGSFDFMPKEQNIRNNIISVLKSNFEKYGYLPIETPIICYYDLLKYKYNEKAEILNEIYKITDQADRKLGLRYDLTVPFCKVIGMQKELKLPFRRYEIGKVYRNGPVKLGRNREFYQCDVDVVGIDGRLIEVEQIEMAIKIFNELNIDIIVNWNNRKLMSGLIIEAGINDELISDVIAILDRKDKISKSDMIKELNELNIDNEIINKLFDLFEIDFNLLKEKYVNTNNNYLKEGIDEISEVFKYLKELNIDNKCYFNPYLARGLSIYTGIVFEFYDSKKRLNCALGGGGRYDKIITEFIDDGNTYPAIGLSFGLEPIYTILKKDKKYNSNLIDIYLIPMNTEVESLKLAIKLRQMGYKVIVEMNSRKVKRCFEYADKEKIPYVIVLGENEINSKSFNIKDMKTSKEIEISFNDLNKIDDLIKG